MNSEPSTTGPTFTGVVEHGDARGRQLGFPTANLPVSGPAALDGVWAGTVTTLDDGRMLPAAISIGRRTTFYRRGGRLLEAHLLDVDDDLYGREITVRLGLLIRRQIRFTGVEELVRQIGLDVQEVRSWAAIPGAIAIGSLDADGRAA